MIDEALLLKHAERADPRAGSVERFIQPTLGSGHTVAVLSGPSGAALPVGWVICHSLGLEQTHLSRLDVQAARALSGAGFRVLRFHGQGYGDSEGGNDVGLRSHIEDATDAVQLLASEPGVERVGVIGARFGGTVAALVAHRLALPFLVMWEPVVIGSQFMRAFLRSRLFSDWTSSGGRENTTIDGVLAELDAKGWVDVCGFRLSARARDELEEVDLLEQVRGYRGTGLLLGVSRDGEPSAALAKLASALGSEDTRITLRAVADPFADAFGQYNLRMNAGTKHDTLSGVGRELANATVNWALEQVGAGGGSP